MKNNKKGFTLVELVIVVAVMAILVAVAIPTVASITTSARNAVAETNCRTIESVIKLYEAEVASGTGTAADLKAALENAKLGIKPAGTATSTVFKYDPTTGVVSTGTGASGTVTITFNSNGGVASVEGYTAPGA